VSDKHPGPNRALAENLAGAWAKYAAFFGEAPHGTPTQLEAMLELLPDKSVLQGQDPARVKAILEIFPKLVRSLEIARGESEWYRTQRSERFSTSELGVMLRQGQNIEALLSEARALEVK
jgi:hypothetical protein